MMTHKIYNAYNINIMLCMWSDSRDRTWHYHIWYSVHQGHY